MFDVCAVESDSKYSPVMSRVQEQFANIPAHQNQNITGRLPDVIFLRREKNHLGTRLHTRIKDSTYVHILYYACMYMLTCIHTHMHIYTYTWCSHIHAHTTCTYTCMFCADIHNCTHTHTCTRTHKHTHNTPNAYTVHIHTRTRTYTHMHIHTHTHTHTLTHTHTYTLTHTHTVVSPPVVIYMGEDKYESELQVAGHTQQSVIIRPHPHQQSVIWPHPHRGGCSNMCCT